MRYAMIDEDRIITNIVVADEEMAAQLDLHYLGDSHLGIGEQYPAVDLTDPVEPDAMNDLLAMVIELKYELLLSELGVK